MAETLTLTTPITIQTVSFTIKDVFISKVMPAIKVTVVSNLGQEDVFRYVESETVSKAEILNAINYIGQGKFKTIDGLNLNDWLIDQMIAKGFKIGTRT